MTSKALVRKTQTVGTLEEGLKKTTGVYITDFTGITVETVTKLRNTLRGKGIYMKVAKNTLIKRALGTAGIKGLDAHLKGPSAVILADDQDPMAPAKALVAFHKDNEGLLALKGVAIDGTAYPGSQLASLAKMPGKKELQASVVSLALGPGSKVAGIIKGPGAKLAGQIEALIEKLEGGAK